jgi:hypothetical protein
MRKKIRKGKSNRFGYVYILSNPSIRGIKIGLTERHVIERIKELNRATGVPTPFKIEYYTDTQDCYALERAMHKYYSEKRINNKREFFKLSIWRAKRRLKKEKRKIEGASGITKKFIFLATLVILFSGMLSYNLYIVNYDVNELINNMQLFASDIIDKVSNINKDFIE